MQVTSISNVRYNHFHVLDVSSQEKTQEMYRAHVKSVRKSITVSSSLIHSKWQFLKELANKQNIVCKQTN